MNDILVFRSADLAQRLGVSYRRLDRWCRDGVLRFTTSPRRPGRSGPFPGSGSQRLFTPEEARIAAFVMLLSDLGAEMRVLWLAAAEMRAYEGTWRGLVAVTREGSVMFGTTGMDAAWVVNLEACERTAQRAA